MMRTRSQADQTHTTGPQSSSSELKMRTGSFDTRHAITSPASSTTSRPKVISRSGVTRDPQDNSDATRSVENALDVEECEDQDDGQDMLKWGWTLLIGSCLTLALGTWSIAIGPHVERSGLTCIDLLVEDTYYKYLLVLLIPVTSCYVIVNWWGLKIFRHA